jgi:hypothetical protein
MQIQDTNHSIQTLYKIYQKEDKYNSTNNIFDNKLYIFYDLYFKVGINLLEYTKTFAIILAGEAKDYYFNKISRKQTLFENIILVIKSYFETK